MSDTAALQCPRSITDEDRARAQIYQLLAVLLSSPPSDELLKGLASLQGDDTPLGSAYKNLAALAQRTTAVDAEQEFNNLFIGVGRGELLPYASYYLTGFLNEKPLADLRTDLMTRGVKVSDGVKDSPATAMCHHRKLFLTPTWQSGRRCFLRIWKKRKAQSSTLRSARWAGPSWR